MARSSPQSSHVNFLSLSTHAKLLPESTHVKLFQWAQAVDQGVEQYDGVLRPKRDVCDASAWVRIGNVKVP